jgi:hypothetical protein
MPDGDKVKPLRLEGSSIEAIIILPKGYSGEYPMPEKTTEELQAKLTEMEAANKTLNDEKAALSAKIATFEAQAKESSSQIAALQKAEEDRQKAALATLASQVADEKIAKGLLSKDKKDEAVASLSKIGTDGLTMLLADIRSFAKVTETKPKSAGVEGSGDATERELAKATLRKELGFRVKDGGA